MDGEVATLRADAERNRRAIIAAARDVFADRGLDASLEEVARRAGVGSATLYRRFPAREDLVCALFGEAMADNARTVDDALANPDPWAGFTDYVTYACRVQARDRALADLMVTVRARPDSAVERDRARALTGIEALIARARQAELLRADFTLQDFVLLLMANAGLVQRAGSDVPQAWERVLAFLLDGLRAGAAHPAVPAPPQDAVLHAMRQGRPGAG